MTGLVVVGVLVVPAAAETSPVASPVATQTNPTATAPTATTVRIRYLDVLAKGGAVALPTRLSAGTYYVHVTTTDRSSGVQVVRPPSGLTTARFYALYRAWWTAANHGSPTTRAAFDRWRTSATFVGGAIAVPETTGSALRTPGGVGPFAITLSPGRYWFYASWQGEPRGTAAQIREVTVVGTPSRVVVPVVAVARFSESGAVSMTRTIPTSGFVLGVGARGWLSLLGMAKLLPGVTDKELRDGTCLNDWLPPTKQCFAEPGGAQLGGAVSGGASALWYYRLPPGDYAVGQNGTTEAFDRPFAGGVVVRVTVR